MGERIIQLKKIERQLVLYRYFSSQVIKEKEQARSLYGIPGSTIYKDLVDLRDAGLVAVKYDSVLKCYVRDHGNEKDRDETDRSARGRHLNRLYRLAMCMNELYNDPMTYELVDAPDDPEGYEVTFMRGKESCKMVYQRMYPEVSSRTMERDFQVLTNIGFPIRYNRVLQQYDFYDLGEYEAEDWKVYGIFYDEQTKKLCRRCGENTDWELQINYQENIEKKKKGYPREEWEPY